MNWFLLLLSLSAFIINLLNIRQQLLLVKYNLEINKKEFSSLVYTPLIIFGLLAYTIANFSAVLFYFSVYGAQVQLLKWLFPIGILPGAFFVYYFGQSNIKLQKKTFFKNTFFSLFWPLNIVLIYLNLELNSPEKIYFSKLQGLLVLVILMTLPMLFFYLKNKMSHYRKEK
jgi:hypothetical protein